MWLSGRYSTMKSLLTIPVEIIKVDSLVPSSIGPDVNFQLSGFGDIDENGIVTNFQMRSISIVHDGS
jgi:hypothetical protein